MFSNPSSQQDEPCLLIRKKAGSAIWSSRQSNRRWCQISTACALELHQGVTVHVLQPQRLNNHDFIIFHYCSSELQQWDKESKDTFIVVIRCKSEGTYFFLYEDLLVVLHKVWDRKVVTIRRESLFLPTCYNGKLQQWLLTHHSFIGFTQFPLRRLTVKKGKFHRVKSFFCLFNFCRESVYCVPLQCGELEENYGHFSLSTMNGDISVLGQNCATDASNHISLYLHASRNFTVSPNTL